MAVMPARADSEHARKEAAAPAVSVAAQLCNILRLPRELRDMIYENGLLPQHSTILLLFEHHQKHQLGSSLFWTCQQLSVDAIDFVCDRNYFVVAFNLPLSRLQQTRFHSVGQFRRQGVTSWKECIHHPTCLALLENVRFLRLQIPQMVIVDDGLALAQDLVECAARLERLVIQIFAAEDTRLNSMRILLSHGSGGRFLNRLLRLPLLKILQVSQSDQTDDWIPDGFQPRTNCRVEFICNGHHFPLNTADLWDSLVSQVWDSLTQRAKSLDCRALPRSSEEHLVHFSGGDVHPRPILLQHICTVLGCKALVIVHIEHHHMSLAFEDGKEVYRKLPEMCSFRCLYPHRQYRPDWWWMEHDKKRQSS